ncbi:LuxR C-terminal-related transcriptional regulator [Nostocoides japonicum]|uniref:LuxR C-terminal-related transcriptional regulator n=1 Tax=Nostocoides japonicum TaxID=99481 RepID=UPI00138EDED7|nr:LuxR C-terminal-related transcriptional regulator [Tetrasphaera japonica]
MAERDRLALGDAPLTAVVAAAGFGKTTLVEGWRRRQARAAYGTFDAFYRTNARDVGLVLADCARELGAAEDVLVDAIGLLPPDGDRLGAEFVFRTAEALRGIGEPFVCFLDDLQGLSAETGRDVGRLISTVADPQRRFVVATRIDPPWPLQRWRVAGFAEVVTADRLRLTGDEIAELLPPELASRAPAVSRVTGGWPAAMEVVRWRLAADPDLDLEKEVLDLVDYVIEEVLPELPEAETRVLTRTSILQHFPASVAVAVSGEVTAARILHDVQRRTSMVTQLPDGRYSYQAVLREALHRKLSQVEPEAEEHLHRRAAEAWLDEPDTFSTLSNAMDHLIAGRAWTEAIELTRQRVGEIDRHARLDRFVGWLDAIPGRQWRDDLEMALLYCYANLRIGRPAQALEGLHDPTIERNARAAAVAKLIYAWTTGWVTDPREALRLCDEAEPVLISLDEAAQHEGIPQFPGVSRFELAAGIAAGRANAMLGRWDEAAEGLRRMLRHRAEVGAMDQAGVCGSLSYVLAMQGDVAAARAYAEEALQLARDAGLANHHVRIVPALLGQAASSVVTGDRDAALATLRDAASRCRPLRAANLLASCGQIAAMAGVSHSFLAEVDPPLTAATLPIVEQFVTATAARDRSRLGDHAGAERLLQTTSPHELTLAAWVEILLCRAERRSVARWLLRLPVPTDRHGRIVRLLAEASVAASAADASRRATEAADLATEGSLVGVLMNAPAQLWERLDPERITHPMLLEAAARLGTRTALPETLTSRELEVLRLLPYVGSTSELASRLFVSVNTANWHRSNIYRKLGVRRRRAAIERGIELGLVTPDPHG